MKLTAQQQALLPSDDDVKSFWEHGYYISKQILSDEQLDGASAAMDRYHDGQRDAKLPGGKEVPWNWKPEQVNLLRKNDYSCLESNEVMALARNPILGAISARLMDKKCYRLWHDQLLYKPTDKQAGGKPANIGWHTDRSYWLVASSDDLITAWIPFHDVTEKMGTIQMVDGSHKWPNNLDFEKFNFTNADLNNVEKMFDTAGNKVVKIPLELKKGQVSFHHCFTIHGSGPNFTDTPRRSLAVHMQPCENRYRVLNDKRGKPFWHFNNEIARKDERGLPDYTDPACFPMLWEE